MKTNKSRKRLCSALLCLILTVSMLPITGYADGENEAETPTKVTVTFDENGGEKLDSRWRVRKYTPNKAYEVFAKPKWTGALNVFAGWYTEQDGGELITEESIVKNEDHTLYAHWKENIAEAPTVRASDCSAFYGQQAKISISYGYSSTVYNLNIKWYGCDKEKGNKKEILIEGTPSYMYTIPDKLTVGKYFYYGAVTVTRRDNGKSATGESPVITLTVNKTTPQIEAPIASNIKIGDKLSTSILNGGSAKNPYSNEVVGGTFAWKDGSSEVNIFGKQQFEVVFTPTDKQNYVSTVIPVSVNVICEHLHKVKDAAVEATCTSTGMTEGEHCTVCNAILTPQTEVPKKAHDYSSDWVSDQDKHWHECIVCHHQTDEAEHSWNDGVITTQPTTTKKGVKTYTCEECGKTKTEDVPEIKVPSGGGAYVPSTPAAPSSPKPSGSAITSDVSGSTSRKDGETSTKVDQSTADKLVDAAIDNKSTDIVIDTASKTENGGVPNVKASEVTLPTETIKNIAEKTDASLTIKTDVGEIKLDNKAAASVSKQGENIGAPGEQETISIIAKKVKEDTEEVRYELEIKNSGGKTISDFRGGTATITVPVPSGLQGESLICVYIDKKGHYNKVKGKWTADGRYAFSTGHFSTYAMMREITADTVIAKQKAAVRKMTMEVRTKIVKPKSGKQAIRVTWTSGGKIIPDGVQIYRSTKKGGSFGKKPIFTTEKTRYLNTAVKTGQRYYYKVRGYVTIDGETVYTKLSGKGNRKLPETV